MSSTKTPDAPPPPRRPSKKDLETFRARVQRALRKAGLSQRAAETNIGMASGTISKLFTGRLNLTAKTLREIAEQAKAPLESLVVGTALKTVLLEAPETPASDELREARKMIDDLQTELAASRAAAGDLRLQLGKAEDELESARVALDDERRAAATAEAEREAAKRAIVVANDRQDAALKENQVRLTKTIEMLNKWRDHAQERAERVKQLEGELVKTLAKAQKQTSDEAGRLFMTAVGGLGIGMLLVRD